MIRVFIRRNDEGCIASFVVEGHANYSPGNDIVCAAVSAVTVGTVNSINALTHMEMPDLDYGSGLLKAKLDAAIQHHDGAQLLLESMLIMLRSIADTYSQHVKIIDRRGESIVNQS